MKSRLDIAYIMLNYSCYGMLLCFHFKVSSRSIWTWCCCEMTGCFLFSLCERRCFGIWSSQEGLVRNAWTAKSQSSLLIVNQLQRISLRDKYFFLLVFVGKMLGMEVWMLGIGDNLLGIDHWMLGIGDNFLGMGEMSLVMSEQRMKFLLLYFTVIYHDIQRECWV